MQPQGTSCKKGDIFMADLPKDEGSLQYGTRPVLVISNNYADSHSPVITIIPLTSRLQKNRCQPMQPSAPTDAVWKNIRLY